MPQLPRVTSTVTLADLRAAGPVEVRGAAAIDDVTHDSRQARPGVLFACRPGHSADGHDFAGEAVARGASALLVERWLDIDVPQARVPSVARVLGPASALVHGHPSRDLLLVGITGTNGKTTSAYMLEAALAAAGQQTGLVGTIETRVRDQILEGVRTTPESTDLQRLLRRMVGEGVTAAAMEVSSHGLALGRVRGTRFRVALFTNLTQDHLDFHGDLESYFAAKASLFTPEYTELGVVNVDDPFGRRLADRGGVEVVSYSASARPGADVRATDIDADATGTAFTALLRGGSVRVRTSLVGGFHVANALGVLAAVEAAGLDVDAAAEGITRLPGVPGRTERVEAGQPFSVLVDYAHTPDSVAHVLAAARALTSGRVLVVLGCGGDRDREKRPLMGAAAVRGADLAVLTSDNPRTEDPGAILAEMAAGAERAGAKDAGGEGMGAGGSAGAEDAGGEHVIEPDRRAAIARALAAAGPGDVVVIAGKGHERTQEVAGSLYPFDDRAVAREILGSGP